MIFLIDSSPANPICSLNVPFVGLSKYQRVEERTQSPWKLAEGGRVLPHREGEALLAASIYRSLNMPLSLQAGRPIGGLGENDSSVVIYARFWLLPKTPVDYIKVDIDCIQCM